MKPAEVRKQVKSGDTAPLYLLEGDDLQSRHDLAVEFGNVVEEGLHAFNVQSYYANEATNAGARDELIGDLLAAARTLPMMAPRRVLIVHEAERLLSPRKARDDDEIAVAPAPAAESAGSRRKRALTPAEELEQYIQSPEPMTTLVFAAGDLDANRRLVKLLRKHAVVVDCGSLESTADAQRWIEKYLERDEAAIEPQAVKLLLETTGLSMGRIRAELEKLVLFAAGEPKITAKHVRELVMPQNEPEEDFAIGKAIWNNNVRGALKELTALLDTGQPPFLVLGQIRAAVARLKSDDHVRHGLDRVFQVDQALKSSAGEPRYLLECLIIEVCGRPVVR